MSETVAAGAGTGSEAAAAGSVAEAAAEGTAEAESASERGASELAAAVAGAARESGTPPQQSHNQTTAFRKTEDKREARNGCRQDERKLRGVFCGEILAK